MKDLFERMRFNDFMALLIITLIFSILFYIVSRVLGGIEMLYLIVGHILAWGEMIVLYYFRKKQDTTNLKPPG